MSWLALKEHFEGIKPMSQFNPDTMVMRDGVAYWKKDYELPMNTTLPQDKKSRKAMPMKEGLLDYFPRALAYVAHVSYVANEQHNPGEKMHWAKEKSTDHGDCIMRHLVEEGGRDEDDGLLHSGKLAWRGLALLQIELDKLSPEEFENLVKGSVAKLEAKKTPPPAPADPVENIESARRFINEKRQFFGGSQTYWVCLGVFMDAGEVRLKIMAVPSGFEMSESVLDWTTRRLV